MNEHLVRKFTDRAQSLGAQVHRFSDFLSAKKFVEEFPRQKVSQEVGLMTAQFGIAETGTLVQFYQEDQDKLSGILPEICLALLATSKIVETADELCEIISSHLSQGKQVGFISGPSRTADIECQLQIGVHGPAELIILLVEQRLE